MKESAEGGGGGATGAETEDGGWRDGEGRIDNVGGRDDGIALVGWMGWERE